MRMLGSRYSGRLLTAVRMERRRTERAQMHVHESDGLRLSCIPLLRHDHLSRLADRGVLCPYISGDPKAGQSHAKRACNQTTAMSE